MDTEKLGEFISFVKKLSGDEKGEAQIFCDRFFRAFGHGGIIEANGSLEARIKFNSGRTKFADCLWSPPGKDGVLIEMKKKSIKNLDTHFPQARDYWIEMNPEIVIGEGCQKPKYIILCNFETFLIYNQLTFVDEIKIDDLIDRSTAFNFMLPNQKNPIFNHNVEDISKDAAKTIGEVFKYLIFDKQEKREIVQRFLLQCVLSMFSEDFNLLPDYIFTELVRDCLGGESSYDLLGGLFSQMANPNKAKGGRYENVPYFNGGLFDVVEPIELDDFCLHMLFKASNFNWKHVNPAIFGSLFESTMSVKERHAFGAHFTSEQDILKIVNPTIIRPWKNKIDKAKTLTELKTLIDELSDFKVLDPSCGCGNFLFIAYRSLKNIEMQIIEKINMSFSKRSVDSLQLGLSRITTKQFKGIDIQPIAVEVAKMTMMLAKELASDEWNKRISPLLSTLGLSFDEGLPLDRLDDIIECKDALLEEWPEFNVVIGNPPYQSKNKIKQEMDNAYIETIRSMYPEIPGRADYCTYWFRKAHILMKEGQYAGLVGTNTIRENDSRIGSLDFIIENNGIITDAVSSQVWSGDAAVHVSIVNWIKNNIHNGKKTLATQMGNNLESPFEYLNPDKIYSSLKNLPDVSKAKKLSVNSKSGFCYQGQTHGNKNFLLSTDEAQKIINSNQKYKEVIFPFLIGEALLGSFNSAPDRFVIDFRKCDIFKAKTYDEVFGIIEKEILPEKEKKANVEKEKNEETLHKNPKARINRHHQNFLKKWWKLSYDREELMVILSQKNRYICCSIVTKRPIFEMVSTSIHPNAALQVFPLEDNYSFGILQSNIHWKWFNARCSTLEERPRYTSDTVFDSFPWPQNPKIEIISNIAELAESLRIRRREVMQQNEWSLRDLYRIMETTSNNPISEIQEKLDSEVKKAYGMKKQDEIVSFLFNLNQNLSKLDAEGKDIQGPGLPSFVKDHSKFISSDCVMMEYS